MAVKNKIFIPTLISSAEYQPVRTLPHLYFYNGLKDCEDYYIQHYPSGSNSSVVNSLQTKFPYLDYYDGLVPTTGSNSLLFFNETPPYGDTPLNSLYTTYWDKYVSLLYNPRTRLINASAIIPLADYFEMELNDIVQWRGNYYHLRAINDYNLKDGTCNIQLLGPIISDAVTSTVFDCTFNFSSSFEAIVPTTTTTFAPTTSTTTAVPTTSTTTAVPTTSTTTLTPTTSTTLGPTTSTTTAGPAPLPQSGSLLFRLEPTRGTNNLENNGITPTYFSSTPSTNLQYFSASANLITDITASSYSNNVINVQAMRIDNFSSSDDLGTVIVVYRVKPTGLPLNTLQPKQYFMDARSAPYEPDDSGPADSWLSMDMYETGSPYAPGDGIGPVWYSGSFYAGYTGSLSKYAVSSSLAGTGSFHQLAGTSGPSGSYGIGIQSTIGYTNYKFYAFSPTASLQPVATTPSWSLALFSDQSIVGYNSGDASNAYQLEFGFTGSVVNIAAVAVYSKVLTDNEVRDVYNYYTSSLDLDI